MSIEREEILSQIRNHIEQAAMLLRSLGNEYERTAWMVEDSAQYLEVSSLEGEVRWQDFVEEGESASIRGEYLLEANIGGEKRDGTRD